MAAASSFASWHARVCSSRQVAGHCPAHPSTPQPGIAGHPTHPPTSPLPSAAAAASTGIVIAYRCSHSGCVVMSRTSSSAVLQVGGRQARAGQGRAGGGRRQAGGMGVRRYAAGRQGGRTAGGQAHRRAGRRAGKEGGRQAGKVPASSSVLPLWDCSAQAAYSTASPACPFSWPTHSSTPPAAPHQQAPPCSTHSSSSHPPAAAPT